MYGLSCRSRVRLPGGCLSFNQKQNQGIGHIYLVTKAQTVNNSGSEWVFTDGHATMAFSEFFDDLKDLDEIDWEVMESQYWNDTPTLPDRKRRRQAEFLIKDCCPWELFSEIGIINSRIASRVKRMLENSTHQPTVQIHRDWYY